MNVNAYVVRFETYCPGSSSTHYHDMQFWAYSAADAMVQGTLWIKEDSHDSSNTRVFRITPGVLHCPTCKGELVPDMSGAWNIMFCPECKCTWAVPMTVRV